MPLSRSSTTKSLQDLFSAEKTEQPLEKIAEEVEVEEEFSLALPLKKKKRKKLVMETNAEEENKKSKKNAEEDCAKLKTSAPSDQSIFQLRPASAPNYPTIILASRRLHDYGLHFVDRPDLCIDKEFVQHMNYRRSRSVTI